MFVQSLSRGSTQNLKVSFSQHHEGKVQSSQPTVIYVVCEKMLLLNGSCLGTIIHNKISLRPAEKTE